jgi:hypothetical protein
MWCYREFQTEGIFSDEGIGVGVHTLSGETLFQLPEDHDNHQNYG